VRFDRDKVKGYLRTWESKGYLVLKPEKLQWTPYLLTRSAIEEAKAKAKKVMANGVQTHVPTPPPATPRKRPRTTSGSPRCVKYEEAVTPGSGGVFGAASGGLPVSDERSTLEELVDEDAEGSSVSAENAEVECCI
jgi:hypothetical protein